MRKLMRSIKEFFESVSAVFGAGAPQARGFTGHEHIRLFNLINMNARLYGPRIGRFLSPDSYIPDPENPQSYNRYTYALNNPLSYVDPSGNDPLWGVNNDNTGKGNAGSKASYRYGYYDYHTFQKKTKDEETAATEASPDESELVFPMFYRTSTGGLYVAWSEEQIPGCDKGQIEVVGEYENTALENAGETIIDFTNDAVDFFTDPNPHAFRMHHHYRYGRGEPIDVDATTLELDGITQKDLVKVVKTQDLYTLDLFNTQGGSKRYTHSDIAFGTFTLRKDGEDQFSILNDRYDHDMKSWTEKPLRNAATGALFIYDFFAGDPYSTLLLFGLNTYYGWGLYGYDIRFYNKIKIPKGK